ncbi:MAG: histidine triad nucleotide-binding protein [Acidobacteriota bacterium]
MSSCIFCQIVRGELSSDIVQEDDRAIAFRDVTPQAPTHILVIPKDHISSLSEAPEEKTELLGHLLLMVREIARAQELDAYRVVINDGAEAGQTVFHLHVHLLAGRLFSWPPG